MILPEYESQIVANMSIHRAASVFKILDLNAQKTIIRELPPFKTAELLNELPADDRTDFFEELPGKVVKELVKLLNPERKKSNPLPARLSREQCGPPHDPGLYFRTGQTGPARIS